MGELPAADEVIGPYPNVVGEGHAQKEAMAGVAPLWAVPAAEALRHDYVLLMIDGVEMNADVDLRLGRWRSAVENLLLGGDATRACALAAKRNLFPVAMAAAAEAERADDENEAVTGGTAPKKGSAKKVSALRETVAAAYAEKLCEERRHEDAAVVLLSAGRARGAMRAYADAGAWRPALALAGRLKLPADERLALASELALRHLRGGGGVEGLQGVGVAPTRLDDPRAHRRAPRRDGQRKGRALRRRIGDRDVVGAVRHAPARREDVGPLQIDPQVPRLAVVLAVDDDAAVLGQRGHGARQGHAAHGAPPLEVFQ